MNTEYVGMNLRPRTMELLQPAIEGVYRAAAGEQPAVQVELQNLANEFRARLQRYGVKDAVEATEDWLSI